ncbi:hypothetical protein C7960_1612 [Methanohalophilus euhalobius]|uniref:Uncharacterized protein n=1 Tax=Methanohalophilus euhalobius TaxID=51203 RepID=A0A285F7B9_9EURY|nr:MULTISPECIES: hypothetical protein [Methanohalophilus]ODV49939.1 MAG: hypothetical protein A8273_598 [Methanohalophilus sp. 2-GBenrich]RXG34881.1 hypothetical protein CI957_475 [Methanohalophilus sp. WG1-DM]TCL12364.1 hypothetical protein C7960_1612 [Methanohalophilus euhalobius]SNY06101.1 hypothetical protein SAMN06295989_10329 [Methanohalophilus euhalobius]
MTRRIIDRIFVEKDQKEKLYSEIDILEEKSRKEQFFMAMSVGFKNGVRRKLIKKDGMFLLKNLQPEDETILNSIAISETDSVEVIADKEKVYAIAEEYANAGIQILYDKVNSVQLGTLEKHLESEIAELYRQLDINNKE